MSRNIIKLKIGDGMFDPKPNSQITIGLKDFTFVPHPMLKEVTFAQEGRLAIIYAMVDSDNQPYALKQYKLFVRDEIIEKQTVYLQPYSLLAGLHTCNRFVITQDTDPELVKKYPELEFAIVLPWVSGYSWFDFIATDRQISSNEGLDLALQLSSILATMENHGIAHCRLSSTQVMIDLSKIGDQAIEIIGFDNVYGPGSPKPKKIVSGFESYTHRNHKWGGSGDRFAGAILLLELLTRHDTRILYASENESYFNYKEIHTNSKRFSLALEVLREQGHTLPAELFSKAWFSETLEDCPTLSDWAKALRNPDSIYRKGEEKRKHSYQEAKLILVGQGSVGKTSLVHQILYSAFNFNLAKTEGISINYWTINESQQSISSATNSQVSIKLNIWDFGGQEILHATHQFFLTKRSLYLLILDSRLTQEENRVEYWLKIIQSFGGESPVLIVGNKIDQHPLDIDRTGLQKKYPNVVGILETSAATGAGIEELKAAITEQVKNLPHIRDLLPETWFTVKTKLEELGKQSNFITHDKYLELCAENEVSDETSQRTLIGFLHDLGVVLHFQDDPRLEALGILNPQWVTNGVYKILNSHTLFQNKGVLTTSMLDEILNLPDYPRGKRLFIVDMMKKFELCYDIQADKTFLVPDLLPKDEPAELKFNGVPAFEYAYPVLPSSVITRFIVRMNQKIDDGLVWRTGVVLKIGENKALVKADIEDRKITIAIDGLEHMRRDALSAIRYQLDEIHNSIKGLNPEKRVPIPEAPNAEPIEYDYLLMLEREGQETHLVKDGTRLVKVNVRQVLSAIETENQRKEQGGNVTHIYVGGNFDGNLTVGDGNQSIKDSYNKIISAKIDAELKDTLKQLVEAVEAMNKSLPEEQSAEVTEDLGRLVDEATKSKPNKKWYSVSIEGLIKAAENLDKLGTPVISLSKKVLSLLTGGVVK